MHSSQVVAVPHNLNGHLLFYYVTDGHKWRTVLFSLHALVTHKTQHRRDLEVEQFVQISKVTEKELKLQAGIYQV
jgi:hypothetical protein